MSPPQPNNEPQRVYINPFPNVLGVNLNKHWRAIAIFLAGFMFASANWTFLFCVAQALRPPQACQSCNEPQVPPPVHATFVDWIPSICSMLGMAMITLVDRDRIRGSEGRAEDEQAVSRARLFFLSGVALMTGGLVGSIMVVVLKYILPGHPEQYILCSLMGVWQNAALMSTAFLIWVAQSSHLQRASFGWGLPVGGGWTLS